MCTSIKRFFKKTHNKIMGTIGATSHATVMRPHSTRAAKKAHKVDQSIPEALLIAARNSLPPVQFHHVHGQHAVISKNKCIAKRTQGFSKALVFSNRVILPNERVYIKVLEISKGWSGTIRFGFTSVDPVTLQNQLPIHACPDMTNAGHTWARALADEVVRKNSVIHFSYNTNGFIYYGINNQDCGIFFTHVNTNQNLWFLIDIYGLTSAVEIIDPRTASTTHLPSNKSSRRQAKILGQLNEVASTRPQHNQLAHSQSEYNLNTHDDSSNNTSNNASDDEPFALDSSRTTLFKSTSAMDDLIAQYNIIARREKKKRRKATRHSTPIFDPWVQENLLHANGVRINGRPNFPDLSPIVVPAVQQNIYGPMPCIVTRDTVDVIPPQAQPSHQVSTQPPPPPSHNVSTIKQNQYSSNKALLAGSDVTGPRHTTTKKTVIRDKNNASPHPIKDCPICFERPINCVLYQCGHMCTCYECGVKQWRTQSKSCPICRTVIKDVIKAYIA